MCLGSSAECVSVHVCVGMCESEWVKECKCVPAFKINSFLLLSTAVPHQGVTGVDTWGANTPGTGGKSHSSPKNTVKKVCRFLVERQIFFFIHRLYLSFCQHITKFIFFYLKLIFFSPKTFDKQLTQENSQNRLFSMSLLDLICKLLRMTVYSHLYMCIMYSFQICILCWFIFSIYAFSW